MISSVLSFWFPGPAELFVILVISGTLIVSGYFIVKLVLRNKNENIRLRLEVGRLAGELEQVRKQKKSEDEGDTSNKSD
ncbi:MAG: hypothetical protein PVJ60_04800 [Phycisphaerales bacterium]|jgi:hypothetical protein